MSKLKNVPTAEQLEAIADEHFAIALAAHDQLKSWSKRIRLIGLEIAAYDQELSHQMRAQLDALNTISARDRIEEQGQLEADYDTEHC